MFDRFEFDGPRRLRQQLLITTARAATRYHEIEGRVCLWWRQYGDPGYAEVFWPCKVTSG